MKKNKALRNVLVIILVMVIGICGNLGSQVKVEAASMKLSKTSATLAVKQKLTLKVTGTTKKVSWKSSNTSVASVSNGKVTAKKTGNAVITATIGTTKLNCKIQVRGDYRALYKKFLTGKSGYFYVLDVNRDGLPELIYASSGSVREEVYSVVSGKLVHLGDMAFNGAGHGYKVYYNKSEKALWHMSLSYRGGGVVNELCRVSGKKLV